MKCLSYAISYAKEILPSGVYHLHILLYVPPKKHTPWQTTDIVSLFQIPFSKAEQVSCAALQGRVVGEKEGKHRKWA